MFVFSMGEMREKRRTWKGLLKAVEQPALKLTMKAFV